MKANCQTCGAEFKTKPSRVKRGVGKYCSWPCFNKAARASANQANYVGGVSRRAPREHCAIAARYFPKGLPRGFQVHHINEQRRDNRECNLVVCTNAKSHKALHALPELLGQARWLGEPGESVRLFSVSEDPAKGFCLRCRTLKPLSEFCAHGSLCRACKRAEAVAYRARRKEEAMRRAGAYRKGAPFVVIKSVKAAGEAA